MNIDAPLLYSAVRLPAELIARMAALLTQHRLLPQPGYLPR
jgi:hypothetical protein